MQIKTSEVLAALAATQALSTIKLAPALRMAVYRLARELSAIEADYQSVRLELIEEHADKDAAGKTIFVNGHAQFKNGNGPAFASAFTELQNTPAEVTACLELKDLDEVELLEPAILLNLGALLKVPDEPDKNGEKP